MMKSDMVSIKGQIFPTMVAITEAEQCRGLMYQKWPPPIMVFPYKRASIRKFWMQNTISPLDIIFCRSNYIIGIFKGEPNSTKLVGPNEPVDLVVELPAGMAAELGVSVGDYVSFSPTKITMERQKKYGVSF
jgi:uncharacterized membrane protein (UPF0127 family)